MDIVGLVVGLVSGAVGGNVAGNVMKSGMGVMGKSLTGIVGGTGLAAAAQYIPGLESLFSSPADAGTSASSIIGSLASGAVGGTALTAILGKVMGNKA